MSLLPKLQSEFSRAGIRSAVLYCRVSSDKQKDNTSIPGQVDYLEKVLQPCGAAVIKVFKEVGSGKDADRPALAAAYDFCRAWNRKARKDADRIKLLAIYDWSRWFRNRDHSSHWRVKFQQIGVMVNCPSKWVDHTDPGSVILHSVQEGMAHAEHLVISQRAKKSHYDLARRGRLSGRLPRWLSKTNEVGPDGKQVVTLHPENAPAFKRAFEMIASGIPAAEAFRRCGGTKHFGARSTFYEAIQNPVCFGVVYKKSTIDGMPDIESPSAYPSLVSKELFMAAQRKMKTAPAPKTMASDQLFPAKAVLKCPVCLGSMTSEMPLNRTGKTYFYYRCSGSQHVRIPKKAIDSLLDKVLQELSISPAAAQYAQKRIKEKTKEAAQAITNRIAVLRQKHEQAAARVKKARGLVVDGVLSAEDLAEVKAEFTEIGGQIAQQEFFKANQGRIAKIALSMLGNLAVIKEKATPEEFAYFLRVLFPEGFIVEPHDLGHCRTTRINSIFNITALGPAVYSSIKIENVRDRADIPGMGPLPDANRTALDLYRADLQAAEAFYFEVFTKIAA